MANIEYYEMYPVKFSTEFVADTPEKCRCLLERLGELAMELQEDSENIVWAIWELHE